MTRGKRIAIIVIALDLTVSATLMWHRQAIARWMGTITVSRAEVVHG